MIEIICDEPGTEEFKAAEAVRDAIASLWPGIDKSPVGEDSIKIKPNTNIAGYSPSDIDIVVVGKLRRGRFFVPKKPLKDQDGQSVVGVKVEIRTFVIVIEVKGHSSQNVRISGDNVSVKYSGVGPIQWKDATEQNRGQLHTLKSYLVDRGAKSLFVLRCLMMQGLPKIDVPGAVPATFTGTEFFTEIASLSGVRKYGRNYVLSSSNDENLSAILASPIFAKIVPSALDRSRMDRIASRAPKAEEIAKNLGEKRIHLRGHGGTGKTVLLLQSAWRAYTSFGKRSILLTYNHALASDIQRVMALMKIPPGVEHGGIEVRTVMSFIFSWLSRLGVIGQDEDIGFGAYDEKCREALDLLKQGAVTREDLEQVMNDDRDRFKFDAVLIDEAQDWPQPEADLICEIYGAQKILLADGTSQLVRGAATDWQKSLPSSTEQEVISLSRCLRMKGNLGKFVNKVAKDAGFRWGVEINDEAAGGRIIVTAGEYASKTDLQSELLKNAKAAGNEKIDFLHCVPPSGVCSEDGHRNSLLGTAFRDQGEEVWDGVDESVRHDYPRSKDTYRVLQYQSCRGLEGWVTVLDGFDEFWKAKYEQRLGEGLTEAEERAFRSIEDLAEEAAWRWAMIALTRPIDSLVITIRDVDSRPAQVLKQVALELPDVVECDF